MQGVNILICYSMRPQESVQRFGWGTAFSMALDISWMAGKRIRTMTTGACTTLLHKLARVQWCVIREENALELLTNNTE